MLNCLIRAVMAAQQQQQQRHCEVDDDFSFRLLLFFYCLKVPLLFSVEWWGRMGDHRMRRQHNRLLCAGQLKRRTLGYSDSWHTCWRRAIVSAHLERTILRPFSAFGRRWTWRREWHTTGQPPLHRWQLETK